MTFNHPLLLQSGATKKLLGVDNGEEMDVEIYTPKDINAGTLAVEIAPVKRVDQPRSKKELEFDDLSEVSFLILEPHCMTTLHCHYEDWPAEPNMSASGDS